MKLFRCFDRQKYVRLFYDGRKNGFIIVDIFVVDVLVVDDTTLLWKTESGCDARWRNSKQRSLYSLKVVSFWGWCSGLEKEAKAREKGHEGQDRGQRCHPFQSCCRRAMCWRFWSGNSLMKMMLAEQNVSFTFCMHFAVFSNNNVTSPEQMIQFCFSWEMSTLNIILIKHDDDDTIQSKWLNTLS